MILIEGLGSLIRYDVQIEGGRKNWVADFADQSLNSLLGNHIHLYPIDSSPEDF
jgi:hypothetical protein